MRKIIAVIMSVLLVASMLAACSQPTRQTGGGGAKKKYAIIVKSTGNPFNEKQIEGFREAIEELGEEVIAKHPISPRRKRRSR
ncbi:hypothetical protein [Thermoclostridium stercorarium]|uniref:hypothetical protein n=1 Tax=Thermoclostridium stercorarium TaxID=1510 RepID=UPI000B0D6A54|nr:hypothetical protein [Thermoclostridium stercorarium]